MKPCPSSILAVLCMLFKIKSNPMHPLIGAFFPLPYVPARFARGACSYPLVCASSLYRTSQYRRILCPSQRHFRTILVALYLMVWD